MAPKATRAQAKRRTASGGTKRQRGAAASSSGSSAAMKVKRTVAKRKAVARPSHSLPAKALRSVASSSGSKVKRAAPAVLRGVSAVAINLDHRPDRWEKVQCSVAKQAPWLQMERLSAVNGKSAPPPTSEVSRRWSTRRLAALFHWYSPVTVPMSPGERGCCGSHIKAWRIAVKRSAPLLVLEDDAVALSSFSSSIEEAVREAPKDVEMIFLSSKDRGTRKPAGKVLMTPSFVWTTVGYVIWPAAARKLLKMLPMDMPVDNWLAWHISEGAVKAFSVRPAAVRQAQTWNVGSDVPHSDDVAH